MMAEDTTRHVVQAAGAAGTTRCTGRRSLLLLEHGPVQMRGLASQGEDTQTPHDQDELYIIASGTGWFRRGAERVPFGPHDALFVRAGEAHRFEDTLPDFATWVIFYGAKGWEG